MGDDRDLGRKALHVLRFLLQEALRDEGVARAGLLDAAVEFVAQILPNREAVGAEDDTSAHRRIISEFGAQDDVVIPGGEILAARRYFLFVLFVSHHELPLQENPQKIEMRCLSLSTLRQRMHQSRRTAGRSGVRGMTWLLCPP